MKIKTRLYVLKVILAAEVEATAAVGGFLRYRDLLGRLWLPVWFVKAVGRRSAWPWKMSACLSRCGLPRGLGR